MLKNRAGETHPVPAGGSDYDHPILVLDRETKLYSVVYMGCEIAKLDIVGEREKIRAEAQAAADLS